MTGIATGAYAMWMSWKIMRDLPAMQAPVAKAEPVAVEKPKASAHGEGGEHAAPAGEHGAPASEHGESAEHGAAAAAVEPDAEPAVPILSLDEMFLNILEGREKVHTLGLKLDLELFEESSRSILESRASGVKNAIIEASREQDFARLNTVPGKLFFKETLISRINGFLRKAAVRDAHFSSFYLQ